MTLVSHLEELRRRLLVVVGAVVLGAIVYWIFYPQILDFLLRPYCQVRLTARALTPTNNMSAPEGALMQS